MMRLDFEGRFTSSEFTFTITINAMYIFKNFAKVTFKGVQVINLSVLYYQIKSTIKLIEEGNGLK